RTGDDGTHGRLSGETTDRNVEERPSAFGSKFLQRLDRVEALRLEPVRKCGQPRALRRRFAAARRAGEEPVGEWEVRQQSDAEVLTRRYDALLDAAFEQRVVVLGADESRETVVSRDPVGIGDLPGVE